MTTRRVYAPVYLANKRPYGKAMRAIAEGRRSDAERELKQISQDDPVNLSDIELVQRVGSVAFDIDQHERSAKSFFDELLTILPLCVWSLSGRRIIQFDSALTTEFQHTDVDGMMLSDLSLPWQSFYIAFDGPDAPNAGGMPIDGVIVSTVDPDSEDNEEENALLMLRPLMKPTEPWTSNDRQTTWTLIANGKDERDLSSELSDSARDMLEITGGMQSKTAVSALPAEKRGDLLSYTMDQAKYPQMLERVINLCVNALLYLSQQPSMDEVWQDGSPQKLVEKTREGGRKGEKATRELVYAGWAQIHRLGVPAQQSDQNVRAHWRRGHWRRQPYGPRKALRKLIRIAPVIVGGNRGEANRQARVTRVNKDS